MSSLFGMLYTGSSGLYTAQAGISVTGNNISNANTVGYSRQRAVIESRDAIDTRGWFGTGASLTRVERVYDDLLASNVRHEMSGFTMWSSMQENIGNLQQYFNELDGSGGLSDALSDYTQSWVTLGGTPPDDTQTALTNRNNVVNKAIILSDKLQDGYKHIEAVRDDIEVKVNIAVDDMNIQLKNIAQYNLKIVEIESDGVTIANELRDKRDMAVATISNYASTNVTERVDGSYAVVIAGVVAVDRGDAGKFTVEAGEGQDRLLTIKYRGVNIGTRGESVDITNQIRAGSIRGDLDSRDKNLLNTIEQIDSFASSLIFETNMVHGLGRHLRAESSLVSSYSVSDSRFPLQQNIGDNFTNTHFQMQAGSFSLSIYDDNNVVVKTVNISIDPKVDSIGTIADKISDASGGQISAVVNSNNQMVLSSKDNSTIAFTADNTGFTAAMGFNSFFNGTGVRDISVSQKIQVDSGFLVAGTSGRVGDNTNALAMAGINTGEALGNISFEAYYSSFVAEISAMKYEADIFVGSKLVSLQAVSVRLDAVTGVSLDEEAINLTKFQKSYEANARFITAVDQMLDLIVNRLGLVGR